jgi:hypothetical protein
MNAATYPVSQGPETVPIRSPRTSILLAEAIRRRREARKPRFRRPWFLCLISQLFDSAPFNAIATRKRPELFFTGAGPLVRIEMNGPAALSQAAF